MAVEARFTIKGTDREIPFTIVEGEAEQLFLYSMLDDTEHKFPLANDRGLLSLSEGNPFEDEGDIVHERLTGLSADWLESRSQGFEDSTDFVEAVEPGYGPDNIFVESKPFSLRQIIDLIDNDDIELTPDFQRNFIWDRTRQSRLIESILLGLPLPSIYLSQYDDGRLTVVDGLQRLNTIKAFMKNSLELTNLEYLRNCNDKRYSELEEVLSPLRLRRFGQTQIMCFVIDYRSPNQLKFDLFRRLNTGDKPLNNQEIRNCLSRPEVQMTLKTMVGLQSFGKATDWSVKDSRMEAREAALRFIYFYEQYDPAQPTGKYRGDMETTLDQFTDELNSRKPESLEQYISIYDEALTNAHAIFGRLCFRKVLPETVNGRRSPVNKLMMLCISVLLSKYAPQAIRDLTSRSIMIEELAEFIQNEPAVFEAITYGTNARRNIEIGFRSFKSFFDARIND